MIQPRNPHPQGKQTVTLTVTQEELAVLHMGIEQEADSEDGEFAYIREIAQNMVLPVSVVTYQNLEV